ncbi:arginyl-tRNA--protein transferase 1-like isoform X1 [Sycon ciliatum]|uniref:arginyl-tRNA--protein transferase 1-like isoform X1 n=2 Tax=Sycon ciliatum TaxID=27933 RepID=UPI0031F6AF97
MSSIAEYFKREGGDGHRCGYCKNPKGSISDGMWLHQLTSADYQGLLDRGWRRSGQYLYKMDMRKTCCPAYTIKCDAVNFKLSQSQKKVLKTMTKFLTTPADTTPAPAATSAAASASSSSASGSGDGSGTCSATSAARHGSEATVCPGHTEQRPVPRSGSGADPTKPPCRKAKDLRRERKAMKASASAGDAAANPGGGNAAKATVSHSASVDSVMSCSSPTTAGKTQAAGKTLEEFAVETIPGQEPVHRLTTALVPSGASHPVFKATRDESFALYCKYQARVHDDKPEDLTLKKWERFLVTTPLTRKSAADGIEYGSFHRHYYLDGKLIAVGVIDILPNALSSVYAYYDPDMPHLSLGTYTALREVMYTRELHRSLPELQSYYMGFYIHNCVKMRYKGNYTPSYLLCPERQTWVPIEDCKPRLDVAKYSRLDASSGTGSVDAADGSADEPDLQELRVLIPDQGVLPYPLYEQIAGTKKRAEVREYHALVGDSLAQRILLVLQL